jgi:hypothetical protein
LLAWTWLTFTFLFVFLGRLTTTAACSFDLHKFPMDKQACKLEVESCTYFSCGPFFSLFFFFFEGGDTGVWTC